MTDVFGFQKLEDAQAIREGRKKPTDLSEAERDYYLERRYLLW
jgi:succinate dehydrogenase / fumarate reductase flavoprotein subunit